MNLHAAVRGLIATVNPDRTITWRQSTGDTTGASGVRAPSYADSSIRAQIQAATGDDLQHTAFQNQQGVFRKVYMFGDVEGVVRVDAKGGDLLLFPQVLGGAVNTWLVVHVLETWTPDAAGWCCVLASLQDGT